MRVLDYIVGDKSAISYDEYGNLYVDSLRIRTNYIDMGIPFVNLGEGTLFMSKEDCEKYNQYEIIDEDNVEYSTIARRPYYRMRGKPVTEKQAFDIIRRTNSFFGEIKEIREHADFYGGMDNYWSVDKNLNVSGYGWVHTDGTIGINGLTVKYPEKYELWDVWFDSLCCFPYLDFIVAVTDWNEVPYEAWENGFDSPLMNQRLYEYEDWDERFYESVEIGIYVHDKVIEILSPEKAVAKYKEYATLYEKNREMYIHDWYKKHGIGQVNLTYLKRCIESYGLDADVVLSKIFKHI